MKTYGIEMVDAKQKLTTTITAEDVANAVPTDPSQCAIAQSLRRAKGVEELSIGASMVYVRRKGSKVIERYALPKNEKALIREFDKQAAFPCGYTVTLEPPAENRKIGARKGERSGTNVRSGKGENAVSRTKKQQPTRHIASPA